LDEDAVAADAPKLGIAREVTDGQSRHPLLGRQDGTTFHQAGRGPPDHVLTLITREREKSIVGVDDKPRIIEQEHGITRLLERRPEQLRPAILAHHLPTVTSGARRERGPSMCGCLIAPGSSPC
jgi:hypothetical protein